MATVLKSLTMPPIKHIRVSQFPATFLFLLVLLLGFSVFSHGQAASDTVIEEAVAQDKADQQSLSADQLSSDQELTPAQALPLSLNPAKELSAPTESGEPDAAPGPVVVPPVGQGLPNHSAYIGQVILGLLLVLGMIFAIAWLLRRFGQGTLVGSQHMKIVSSLALGPRERLIIVDVNGEQLLIGVAPGRISQLHHFSDPVVSQGGQGDGDFGSKLKEILSRSTFK